MKKISCYVVMIASACLMNCKHESDPVFPVEPYIEFREIHFTKGLTQNPDTLSVSIYVRDGDFDLGLSNDISDSSFPYQFRNYYSKKDGSAITTDLTDFTQVITYKDKRLHINDTLPGFVPPYNCTRWEISTLNSVKDTVYYQINPNFYNIEVDYYSEESTGWKLFDFNIFNNFPNCSATFNNRFSRVPYANGPFSFRSISSKEMLLTYKMQSYAFAAVFGTKNVKLKVRIRDRALHISNQIETSQIHF